MAEEQVENVVNFEEPQRPGAAGGAPAAPEKDSGAARIKELEAQLVEMKNEGLRHLAEAENTRKRAARDKEETAKFAVTKFARDLLDVADNLQRALAAVKPEMLEGQPAIKNLFVGVEATERQLTAIFERSGMKKIDPMGQPFDPNQHQVMMEVESADKAPGTVVQVLQPGYVIHDRLLRAAMVGVAKGGAAPAAPNGGTVDQKV